MKMRNKIILLCMGCTLGALILQTILFTNTSSNLIYKQAKAESYNSLQNMQNEIFTFIKSIENNLVKVYSEKQFMQELKENGETDSLQKNYYRLAYNLATENFETSDGVVALYLYNEKNNIISTYRRAVTPKHNYPQDIFIEEEANNADEVKKYIASDNTTMLVSSYFNSYRNTNITRFVLKIYNNNNRSDKIGYVVCDIDSKVLKNIMGKYSMQNEMFMWLQPVGDREMISTGKLEENSEAYFQTVIKEIEKGNITEANNPRDENRVLFQLPQKKYNLNAYSLMPQYLLEENQRLLTRNLLLIAAIMIATISGISYFLSRSLSRPLENLTYTIEQIKRGQTDLRVLKNKNDEIGKLGKNFNELLDQIEMLISHEYETKLLLNQAQYKALQAQINPHFLYNTLETMSSIASVQNCNMVSNLCQSLSNIFRYSLDMKNPFSTVAKEIVHLKNYIYVMNVRMGDDILYHFDISEEVLQDSIPRISIQPLVENALNHGLRNKKGEKRILVRAREVCGKLQIVVEDNGIGMDAKSINEKLIENDLEAVEKGTSIGIYNINARMKMLYGEENGLSIESKVGEGTTVYLEIPRKRMEELSV